MKVTFEIDTKGLRNPERTIHNISDYITMVTGGCIVEIEKDDKNEKTTS